MKNHFWPILHNALGTLLAAAIVAIPVSAVWGRAKYFWDSTVPLWIAVMAFLLPLFFLFLLSKKQQKREADAVADFQKEHLRSKAQMNQLHQESAAAYACESDRLLGANADKDKIIAQLRSEVEGLNRRLSAPPPQNPRTGWTI